MIRWFDFYTLYTFIIGIRYRFIIIFEIIYIIIKPYLKYLAKKKKSSLKRK